MTITLHTWSTSDKPALMALCNAVDRTFLSDRLPHRIIGQVFPENVASVRVLEKNGFRLEDVVRASAKSNNLFLDSYFQTS